MTTNWVNCPICGDSDTECNYDDNIKYIHCTNGACASNGGDNATAFLIANEKALELSYKRLAQFKKLFA